MFSPMTPNDMITTATATANAVRLTDAQRQTASNASRALRLAADRLDEARLAGRAELAREALQVFDAAGVRMRQLKDLLG